MVEISFTATNPDKTQIKELTISPRLGTQVGNQVEAGWTIYGKIVMTLGRIIVGPGGSPQVDKNTSDQDGVKSGDFYVTTAPVDGTTQYTYTLEDYMPTEGTIWLTSFSTVPIDTAHFFLNGGTWTESGPEFTKSGDGYRVEIPYGYEVKKPQDPTREGFQFKGWTENPGGGELFNFNEKYEGKFKDTGERIRGLTLKLTAVWEPAQPEITV